MNRQEACRKVGLGNKGKPPWNKGLTKETDVRVMNVSMSVAKSVIESFKNDRVSWIKGKTKEQYPQLGHDAWNKGLTKETDVRVLNNQGFGNRKHEQIVKDNQSVLAKRMWSNPEWAEITMQHALEGNKNAHPNKPEKKIIDILKSLSSDIKYVGDGKRENWVSGKNPDFINKSKKQIIEIFGCYWHCCKKCGHKNIDNQRQKDALRISKFEELGYSVLVIWEHELEFPDNVVSRIRGLK